MLGCRGAAHHGGQGSSSLLPCCPRSLRQTAQHHWQSHVLAKMLLILHTESPKCPRVTRPICPSPSPSHSISAQASPLQAPLPYCCPDFQAFSISAILLGLDWEKWHGEILLLPRNFQVSEQWQRDQAHLTPLGSSTREMLVQNTGMSQRGKEGL